MTLSLFKHELVMDVAQDSGGKFKEFERPRDTSVVDKSDFWDKVHGGNFTVADAGSDSLSLGDVTSPAKGLYLEVSGDCDITLNGLPSPLQVRRTAKEVSQLSKLFLECDITSVTVTNQQAGQAIRGTYRVWGDENP